MKSYSLRDDDAYTLTNEDKWSLQRFFKQEGLDTRQAAQYKAYLLTLIEWNKKINLTSLEAVQDIVRYHFQDSLKVRKFVEIDSATGLVDVGTGGGLPGIALKICFPAVPLILIEVNRKKIRFLEHIINLLSLTDAEVCPLDWRTFLRKTDYNANLFCARASLAPAELIRMFKPGCVYNKAQLVYWASGQWQPGLKELPFMRKQIPYTIGNKRRKFVLFETVTQGNLLC